jgi:predicted phosphodiesterase
MNQTPMSRKAHEVAKRNPSASTRSLARVLAAEMGVTFDKAYTSMRSARGLISKTRPNSMAEAMLPRSIAKDFSPYHIKGKSILILSDVHIPYHNEAALEAALEWGETRKPDTILLNGDTWDMYLLSDFDKDPRGVDSTQEELQKVRQFLAHLRKRFPKAKIIFREGNHEYRWYRHLMNKSVELLGMDEFQLPVILGLDGFGADYVGEKRTIYAGHLAILHGHELPNGLAAPVNAARGLFLKYKASCIMGHSHVTSEHSERDGNGKVMTCWSVGTLGDLSPRFRPINNWNHGCAHVSIYPDGTFHVKNKRIINGKMV